ncbi:MAG: efflux RND transporter permease subunit [Candidatus Gastranaerophilales bacterium]|nr:efflux RND transporter permease subunit [Candidatus Gastranaerophilales bacterium]
MNSNFFIARPRFAIVLSIFITLLGLLSLGALKLEKYPDITPVQINVTATYPGASADVIESTVATVVEQQVNGVENMTYMMSVSTDGSYSLTIYFEVGTDKDIALVKVQNRLQQVMSRLPEDVTRQGLIVKSKVSGSGVLIAALTSPDNTYDTLYLSNYASIYIRDELLRVPGVGEVNVFGAGDFGMRIWMNPEKMASLNVTPTDIIAAVKAQNTQVPAGALGLEPMVDKQKMQFTLRTKGRLVEAEEFENIIIKSNIDGSNIRIKDVARVELGSQNYTYTGRVNGAPAALIQVIQLPNANIIDVAKNARKLLSKTSETLPVGMELNIVRDETEYIKESMSEVLNTIFEACIIVVFLTYIFIGSLRATVIPILAIPISLIGALSILPVLGMSVNTLTLFAMVLAVGTVVDDAIVVIENIERHMAEGKDKREAAIISMQEVGGALIAIALVLMAVFVPSAFIPGLSGLMYKQFAVCIATSIAISAIVALTLSPAISAVILKDHEAKIGVLAWFDKKFQQFTDFYMHITKFFVYHKKITALTFIGLCLFALFLFKIIPTGFLPDEDQGVLFAQVTLPDGAALARSTKVVEKVESILKQTEGVKRTIAFVGISGSNTAFIVIQLEEFKDRKNKDENAFAMQSALNKKFYTMIPEASIYCISPPSISGMSMMGGFEFQMLNKGENSPQQMAQYARQLMIAANQDPRLKGVFTTFQANLPQYVANVDVQKTMAQGVSISDLYNTLAAQFGSYYVNDFNKFDRVFRVYIQADDEFRAKPDDLQSLYVKNNHGKMVPINTMVELEPIVGALTINRFNLYRSVQFNGSPNEGYSSGQAMKAMEEVITKTLPADISYSWSGQSAQELESAGMTTIVIALALLFVYLFLVALYESWTIPVAVLLISPVAAIGALALQYITGQSFNLYSQVGMIMLIGLATKQAILIVEFAKELHERDGLSVEEAAMRAGHLRFRAVIMTSVAFIVGVLPLVFAHGAGSESRVAVGVTVFGGMSAACIFGTLLVPAFYVIIQSTTDRFMNKAKREA